MCQTLSFVFPRPPLPVFIAQARKGSGAETTNAVHAREFEVDLSKRSTTTILDFFGFLSLFKQAAQGN